MRYYLMVFSLLVFSATYAAASPVLYFSDITSGPSTGNSDGNGGAIVTVWGTGLGDSQFDSVLEIGGVPAQHIYYWKPADGTLPGAPANLSALNMQEICFSLPAIPAGNYEIKAVVDGVMSNPLQFIVRDGNIYYVAGNGSDATGDGSFSSPWGTLQDVLSGGGKISPGDIIYSLDLSIAGNIDIGVIAPIVGSANSPIAVIAYPGSSTYINNSDVASFRNYGGGSKYFIFSKFTIDTLYQAFSLFQGSRIVGNNVTGPTINSGYSGWIGGGCAGTAPDNCGGHKIYGNEVHDYGANDGTVDQFQHLFYISNRSGTAAEGFEIGWNYLHDNPIYQGIHIYDQEDCGGWFSPVLVHDNIIENQGGNSININFNCTAGNNSTIDVYNNITILRDGYNLAGLSAPAAAIRVDASTDTTVNINNNTFYGFASTNSFVTGVINAYNNIVYDTRGVDFFTGEPSNYSNNLFFSPLGTAAPQWAYSNADPMFVDAQQYNFDLLPGSQAIDAGLTVSTPSAGFNGAIRPQAAAYDIGAYEHVPGPARSAGAPTGEQPAGTTQVTMSLTTDEAATCRYSTIADTAYADMTDTFATTDGTSHSTVISGLANGGSYTYYVRCAGTDTNADDYVISWSVQREHHRTGSMPVIH